MNKKVLLALCLIVGAVAVILVLNPAQPQKPKEVIPSVPSETFKEYIDPAGFSFSYPDDLSITRNDMEEDRVYADIRLSSKEVSGSLTLKISDSQYVTLDEWMKLNKGATVGQPQEVKLGNLNALELKLNDRLLLGALDQGIFFNIEIPLIEEKFWMTVYNKLLGEFVFVSPEAATSRLEVNTVYSDVTFESEEVIE